MCWLRLNERKLVPFTVPPRVSQAVDEFILHQTYCGMCWLRLMVVISIPFTEFIASETAETARPTETGGGKGVAGHTVGPVVLGRQVLRAEVGVRQRPARQQCRVSER